MALSRVVNAGKLHLSDSTNFGTQVKQNAGKVAVSFSIECNSGVYGKFYQHDVSRKCEIHHRPLGSNISYPSFGKKYSIFAAVGELRSSTADTDDSEQATISDTISDIVDKDRICEEDDIDSSREERSNAKPRKFPLLGNREKKELRAFAHQLGKKLKNQQVGKWGVTPTLIAAVSDALEANEILKLKVLDNCPDEAIEVGWQIEDATDAQVVGRVGNSLILYRPSLTKLAEAKAAKAREQGKNSSGGQMSAAKGSRGGRGAKRR